MRSLLLTLLICFSYRIAWSQGTDSVLIQTGVASFYGERFDGRMTSNGEIFHMDSMTAAHKHLPFDTWVKVTRLDTNDTIWVRINDRLPKNSSRIIDLSKAAARKLGMLQKGIRQVSLKVKNRNEMNDLYYHFKDREKGSLRLRFFDEPIYFDKREFQVNFQMK